MVFRRLEDLYWVDFDLGWITILPSCIANHVNAQVKQCRAALHLLSVGPY